MIMLHVKLLLSKVMYFVGVVVKSVGVGSFNSIMSSFPVAFSANINFFLKMEGSVGQQFLAVLLLASLTFSVWPHCLGSQIE